MVNTSGDVLRPFRFYAIICIKVGDFLKKIFAIILAFSFLILSGCSIFEDKVIRSLGKYESNDYFTSGGFKDFTDYAKYSYKDITFSDNEYFDKISSESKEELIAHIENFESWIEIIKEHDSENDVVLGYDFDSSIISDTDYLYIYDDPDYDEFGNYNVYFFDTETMILYYFHNDI